MKIGDSFSSFDEFKEKLDEFQKFTCTSFFVRDSITVNGCKKKEIKKEINPTLKYYRIKYSCFKGGKKFKTRGKGVRDST